LKKDDGNGDGGNKGYTGPEFVVGKKKRRPHCEPWTVSPTRKPDDKMCAVICRNEPSCVGFAKDPDNGWCVWFDDTAPQHKKGEAENVCSSVFETEYVKMKPGPQNKGLWADIQKIHVFDNAIIAALKLAHPVSDHTNFKFIDWWSYDDGNRTAKLALKDVFLHKMDNYTENILDVISLRKQFVILQDSAYEVAAREAVNKPPLADKVATAELKEESTTPKPVGLQEPEEYVPKPLHWKDFPNSQDTAWSKIHPECPMGTPCFCDCKCRGAPPQNFIEPPPPPAMPCPPPPPLPNPAALTAILNR